MPDSSPSGTLGAEPPVAERLDSWKEIAAYLRRDVTTVQRWEKREGMPVHRHLHDKAGSVYAFRSELAEWARSRSSGATGRAGAEPPPAGSDGGGGAEDAPRAPAFGEAPVAPDRAPEPVPPRRPRGPSRAALLAGAAVLVAVGALAARHLRRGGVEPEDPLANARFLPLTDLEGVEQAAAISPDGRFVAFQSDRDGRMDVWLTQVGSGQLVSLTRGAPRELVNPSIRTLAFTPDGGAVTFWVRGRTAGDRPDIGIWAAPLLGGSPRPYLEGVAEHDWTRDGARLVHHTPGPGDPMYVSDAGRLADARRIFSAPAGQHAHFVTWAPDQRFVYFVQGTLPDRLDLWRIRPDGGAAERLTHHDGLVSHPVFLDPRTLLYLATDPDGAGPWIHVLDVERRASRRISAGVDRYTSLAASADGHRLVATVASRKRTLWRVPLGPDGADLGAARPIALTTGNASSPRLGPGYLLYVSAGGASDGLWKLQDGAQSELWTAPGARIVGGPAIRRDGARIAFSARHGQQTQLWVVNPDGTGARVVAGSLRLEGAPAWSPDGRSITIGVVVEREPRLFRVPVDGGAPSPLVPDASSSPAWSPDGGLLAFSGADVGTTFPLKAVNADGSARPLPPLALTRGARRLAFTPDGRSLAVLRGEIGHKNVWLLDLASGAERQLTALAPDFELVDFDVSPDGRELVLERVQESSDLVLVERPRR